MLDGYSNRMLRAPRFVREGNRLIPQSALVRVVDAGALSDDGTAQPAPEADE